MNSRSCRETREEQEQEEEEKALNCVSVAAAVVVVVGKIASASEDSFWRCCRRGSNC